MDRLQMTDIAKHFGGIAALRGASFSARSGEVHALLGENGAGKSTLMKILAGAYEQESGSISLQGKPAVIRNPLDSLRLGISVIYQEFSLAEHLSVTENILLESLGENFIVDTRANEIRAQRLLADMGFDEIDVRQSVANLPVAYQQVVEICKALSRDCSILVLDEPTAVLTTHETQKLFELVRKLKARGVCIVYISHRLEEIFELCDRATVLKDGRTVGTWNIAELDQGRLTNLMIGRELSEFFPKRNSQIGEVALDVHDLSVGPMVQGVSFQVKRGEVLGIGGLVGAGRTETLRAIFGADTKKTGTIRVHGRDAKITGPGDAVLLGVGLVPEDRKHQGVLLNLPIRVNAVMTPANPWLRHMGIVHDKAERDATEQMRSELKLKAGSIDAHVSTLSGGNQQKVALMKWMASRCEILLLDEPTRGVDVGAKVEIYRVINEFAEAGSAIVMVSSEMLELIGMCDRVLVMKNGRISGELGKPDINEENIIDLAMGNDNVRH